MIQRIQTLLLLLATLAAGLLLWEQLAFCSVDISGAQDLLPDSPLSDGRYDTYDSPVAAGILALILVLNIIAILLFRNRPRQILLSWISLGLMFVFSLVMGVWFYMSYTMLPPNCELSPGAGIILPFLTIIFLFLAIKRIRADENLVRSMDRLR